MPDRPRVWITDDLPPHAKVTIPTMPWRSANGTYRGAVRAWYVHAPCAYANDPTAVLALCRPGYVTLTMDTPDLPPCPRCIAILRVHGLWPLDPPAGQETLNLAG